MLWQYIKEKMMEHPRETVTEDGGGMSFEELADYVEGFSRNLKGKKSCAVNCRSEMAAGIALLACFAAETTVLPLSSACGEAQRRKILDTISPECIINDRYGNIRVFDLTGLCNKTSDAHIALITSASDYIEFSDVAAHTEKNIISELEDLSKNFKISSDDKRRIYHPLCQYSVLVGEYLVSLVNGTGVIFCSKKSGSL